MERLASGIVLVKDDAPRRRKAAAQRAVLEQAEPRSNNRLQGLRRGVSRIQLDGSKGRQRSAFGHGVNVRFRARAEVQRVRFQAQWLRLSELLTDAAQ